MKEIELSDLEAYSLTNWINHIIQKNIQAEEPILSYTVLNKFLKVKKEFSTLLESLTGREVPFKDLVENKQKYNNLPSFEQSEWESLVRGEEVLILQKLTTDAAN